ncbi:hypothetical protein CRG98_024675 [Punica granatum]|uniref:Uncharacterized protein n=1 Tax=Punica granatum TaxID=22663 RepID=A0A2I0JF91_PUNGR|nr:hypothetical protein CRG98_024675 [Punica granatum]
MRCKKLNSHGLADPARLQEARPRCLGEHAVQEIKLARVSRPGKVARSTTETRQGCKKHDRGVSANMRCKKLNSHGLADPARLQEARPRCLGEHAVQEIKLARVSRPGKVARSTTETRQGCKKHDRGVSANMRCKKLNSHGLADPARLQEARPRCLGEHAVQEIKLARVSRPGKVARSTTETRQGCKKHDRGVSANMRCKKLNSHGLADPARLQEARPRCLGEHAVQEIKLARVSRPGKVARSTTETRQGCKKHDRGVSANMRCKKLNSHGLADPARLQEARPRCLGEHAVQEIKLARVSRPGKVARSTTETRQGCKKHDRGVSANMRCKKLNSHGLADPARLQEARPRCLGEHAVQEIKLARVSRPGKVARSTTETRQGCKKHDRGVSANMRCKKLNSHGLADPARLQEARPRCLGEHAVQEIKLARVSRPGKVARSTTETRQGCKKHDRGVSANMRCKKLNSHGLADPARLQEARPRCLGEHAVQEIKLARVSRPGKVARSTTETRQGCKKHDRGVSANMRCKKLNSHGLADPARLQEARPRCLGEHAVQEIKLARVSRPGKVARSTTETRQGCKKHDRGVSANMRCKKLNSHGLADPARLQEARPRCLGEHAVQEIKLARVSRPGKVARSTTETRQGCKKHDRGVSANMRCKKLNSHGLADPARLQEARARCLGELAVQEIKLASVSRPTNVARGTSEVARRTCDPAMLQEARARWLGELAVKESKLARISSPGKVARGTSEVARRT